MSELSFHPLDSTPGIFQSVSVRFLRTRDHDDRNSKRARGLDLGVGRRAAGVLGNQHVNLLLFEKGRLGLPVEGASIEYQTHIGWQRDIVGRIDHARDVMMMRPPGEDAKLKATEAEENTARLRPERVGGSFRSLDRQPRIIGLRLPCGTYDRGEWNCQPLTRSHGVGRNLIGVGMRRVDDRLDGFLLQPVGKSVRTAEAADPRSNGLCPGIRNAPGERKRHLEAAVVRQQMRQIRGFRRASEDENVHRGLFP
jgi:hypothetical protein